MAWTAPCAPSLGAGLSPSYQSSFPGPPHPMIGGWKNRSANRPMGASLLGWASLVRHCAVWLLMYSLSVATSPSFSPCRHSYCHLEAQRAICRFRTSIACLTTGLTKSTSAAYWLSMHMFAIISCNSPLVPVISWDAISARSYFVMFSTSIRMSRSLYSFSQHSSQGGAMSFSGKVVSNLVSLGEIVFATCLGSNLAGLGQ